MFYRIISALLLGMPLCAQQVEKITDSTASWVCTTFKGDPLKTRYFTLKNGFTVIVSPNENVPRFYSCVGVRAGGKDDPANNTGLAHYLEHMLFKGTEKLGTVNYQKEEELLDFIENLYEKYNRLNDPVNRKRMYEVIDSVSLLASDYAIANEYDKLMQQMGVTGTNAFTDYDQTVYINDIPSVQLENWMKVEYERFRSLVLRLFHTELEAVYEEKNISLDADGYKAYEALMSSLFRKHTYGTQTVIGKAEHLKNPSLKEIRKFFNTHYIPGKMALIVAGNVDPYQVAELAAKTFGTMPARPVQSKEPVQEQEIMFPDVKTVYGQEGPFVLIGFRLPSVYKTGLAEKFYLIEQLLANEQAGLIRKNLLLPQKVLSASAGIYRLSDYSVLMLEGRPGEGQSLEEVKNLLLAQLDTLKKSAPDPELLKAIISNLELKRMEESEVNDSRAFRLLETFIHGEDPAASVLENEKLMLINPLEINLLTRNYFKNNYAVVQKLQEPDTSVQKIEKPKISPVNLNRTSVSRFAKDILDNEVIPQSPKFFDIKGDIQKAKLIGDVPLNYVKNKDNKRFTLEFVYENGSFNDPALSLAFRYLQLAGSKKYDMAYLNLEFFRQACTVSFQVDEFQTKIKLSGASERFERALATLEYLLENPAENQDVWNKMITSILQEREDQLTDRNTLRAALSAYALYGRKNPFNSVLDNRSLKKLKLSEMVKKCSDINSFAHQVYYYGPLSNADITALLNKYHQVNQPRMKPHERKKFIPLPPGKREIIFYPHKMLQADIGWLGSGSTFNFDSSAVYNLFNEYFGGGMASIVFQTIREARALAYSCNGYFRIPAHLGKPGYFSAYIGTQADKADSAMEVMQQLLRNLPMLDEQFETARKSRISQLQNEWIRRSSLTGFYQALQNKGLEEDHRRVELDQLKTLSLKDIQALHKQKLANEKFALYVLADPEQLKPQLLRKYGKVKMIDKKALFGY